MKRRGMSRRRDAAPQVDAGMGKLISLYNQPMRATRIGSLFSAFPYPTKISPEAIALFIAAHTTPGDTVFDGFAGSGTTGVAALLCSAPTDAMRDHARRLGLRLKWGARRAVLQEVGVLGSFVGRTLCDPPDVEEFRREAEGILSECERKLHWMYEARDPEGRLGTIRYIIWSEVVSCPRCSKAITIWDGCARRKPARIESTFRCSSCHHKAALSRLPRLTRTVVDDLTGVEVIERVRKPVWLYGVTGKHAWSRSVRSADLVCLARIERTPLPRGIPHAKIAWGDLHRSGYHQGISHLHHFYTRRNLTVFATLWQLASRSPLRVPLRFWLLSYNASHATLMTRVVAKKNHEDFVVTSAQPGVLYISGLPVEKNLFAGLRRKLKSIVEAFTATSRLERYVEVRQDSSLTLDLPDQSVDYVFSDPPFGGNIPYAEVNFINEAWLGQYTDARQEVTISQSQGKKLRDYEMLMTRAFCELHRVLRKDGKATIVFHSSSSEVWNALHRAYTKAGFGLATASILDKTQGSFKQVTTQGAVKGDVVLLLTRRQARTIHDGDAVAPVMEQLLKQARVSRDLAEQTPQRLYSRFVAHYLAKAQDVPLDADEFYDLIDARAPRNDARITAR